MFFWEGGGALPKKFLGGGQIEGTPGNTASTLQVVDCTTPLASLPYKDQLKKKEKDIADFVEELGRRHLINILL